MDDDNSNDSGELSILDLALAYARYGLRIFPVHSVEKRPMPGYGWYELASSQTNHVVEDFDRAMQLWGDQVSVAWALGRDGCLAVDIDVEGSLIPPWMPELVSAAVINITRRGQHLIFRMPEGLVVGNGTSGFPTQGWGEVRGQGGYIIIAGPDRPGLDLGEMSKLVPFPRPDYLTTYGGPVDAVSKDELLAFANAHDSASNINMLNGVRTAIEAYSPDRNGDPAKGRHPFAVWAMCEVAEESMKGFYAFKDGFRLVQDWWRTVTPPERHGREWVGICCWAVGRALTKAESPPTEATNEDESLDLAGDNNTLIQFRELPDPFVMPPVEWHAKGLLTRATHGELGGPEKSMKSYLALATCIAIALGVPVLGHFEVPERQRVLMLSGEGGEVGMLRRVERITAAYGATIDDLRPWLRYTAMTAPLTSKLMIDSIQAAITDFDPAIVWLDPWYAYAPGSAVASSALLTDIGQVLSSWRQAVGVERTAMINHHLNTGGTGDGLQRLAGAGHAEWCDSWMLVDHRERPAVEEGRFRLKLRIGSRQWGGGDYAVDLNVGRFDAEHGIHIGSMSWRVGRLADARAETDDERHQAVMTEAQLAIKRYMRRQGRPVSRSELTESVSGRKDRTRAALDILIDRGEVVERSFRVAGQSGRPRVMCSLAEDQS